MPRKDSTKNKKEEKQEKSYLFKFIVIVLLIIIIILLLLNSCESIGITNRGEYTGDFDIYEITLKGTCECPICETCKTCPGETASSGNNNKDNNKEVSSGEFEPNLEEEKLIVYDNEDEWSYGDDVYQSNIFKHSTTEVINNKIAPGVQNTYKFIVRNLNEFTVKYTIEAIENNPNDINMKYRLRTSSAYLIGNDSHWVDANSITTAFKNLSAKGIDTYYLDWKWFDNDGYDTPIGIDDTASYGISLKVEAEEV